MACARQPLPYPSQEELWSDLLAHPWLYERSTGRRSSNPPVFRCLRTNAGLWRDSAPEWVCERWHEIDALDVGQKVLWGCQPLDEQCHMRPCGRACRSATACCGRCVEI